MRIKILTVIAGMIVLTGSTFAQKSIIKLTGQVLDANTNHPLSFANISLHNSSVGTVTNLEGRFMLHLPADSAGDSLRISYIGYETKCILVPADNRSEQLIRLEAEAADLEEILVKPKDAKGLIERAISNIGKNYARPHTSTAFYRLATQNDQHYMHLSEVVMEQFHPGVNARGGKRQVKMLKMRALMDEKSSHGVELGMRPKEVMGFDLISELEKLDLLNKKGLRKHRFFIDGEVEYDGERALVISFDQIDGLKESLYQGKIFLHPERLAFLYIEVRLSPKGIAWAKYGDGATRALLAILGLKVKMQKDTYRIYYKKYGDHWYLNKVSTDTWLNISSERDYYNFPTYAHLEYVVTKIDTSRIQPFSKEEVTASGRIFENHYSEYDRGFWSNYNIILPDFDFQEIADGIEERNKAFNHKQQLADRIHRFPKDLESRMDSIFQYYHEADLFHGIALIKKGADFYYQKGFGWADEARKIPHRAGTKFRIGSTSKTFTSMLILQLLENGRLDLADPIGKYLPDYIHGEVTIEQLLTHRSGIPNYTNNTQYLTRIMTTPFPLDSLIRKFASDPLNFTPGSRFEYSNSGYVLLAGIIEKITGKPFDQVLQKELLEKTNLEQTSIAVPTSDSMMAVGYHYGKPEPPYPITNVIGAGAITSTAEDLLKWSEALDGDLLVDPTLLERAYQRHARYKEMECFYGYGWIIDEYQFRVSKKHRIIHHPGTDFGFFSMFVKQPDADITVVLLSNHGDFPRFDMTDLILEELN